MSKTSSAVVCETNQIQGQNQENVFFHSLYRVPEEFTSSYVRSARSTAPIQICACFSAQGEDTLAAMTLQSVLSKMQEITAQTQLMSVLDYESFTNQVVTVLNNTVCQESVKNNGANLRVSMSMVIIEGDTLRVLNIGNTHVWLFRDGKLISLTENQTVAHRYVQMGAITKEAEYTHEGRNELTQYLGRFAQDGEVIPDKKVHLKLKDGDEIVMLGTGLDQCVPIQKLGTVIARPTQPETKASEIISFAMDNQVKFGLTALVIRIESTLLLPGDAKIEEAAVTNDLSVAPRPVVPEVPVSAPSPAVSAEDAPTIQSEELRYQMNQAMTNIVPPVGDENEEDEFEDEDDDLEVAYAPKKKKEKSDKKKKKGLKTFLIGLAIFVVAAILGYVAMYILFNAGHWTGNLKPIKTSEATSEFNDENAGQVVYALYDDTALYVEESLDSQAIDTLARGEAVTLLASNDSFAKVKKENGLMGYVPLEMISTEDPTINDTHPTEFYDPTPVPTTTAAPTEATDEPSESTEAVTTPEETTETTPEDTTESTTESMETTPSESTADTTPSETPAETTPSETSATPPSESTTPASSSESSAESASEVTSEAQTAPEETPSSSAEPAENANTTPSEGASEPAPQA